MKSETMDSLHEGWGRWGCFGTLGLLILLLAFGLWKLKKDTTPNVGGDVRSVAFLDAGGQRHTLAEYAGKVVVVDVWATWCPPCRASLPEIVGLQNAADGRYEVLPISVDDGGFKDVNAFLAATPMALKAYVPADRNALEPFGAIVGIPTTLIVGANGKLITRWSGYYQGRAEKEMRAALK